MAYKTVSELTEKVWVHRLTIKDMPREAGHGYPVPVMRKNQLMLGYPFFVVRGRPGKPAEVSPPGWIIYVDVRTGENVESVKLDVDLGISLGVHQIDPSLKMEEFLKKEEELTALLDELLPLVDHYPADPPADVRLRVRKYNELWQLLAHKPLRAFYRQQNPGWFEFLETK